MWIFNKNISLLSYTTNQIMVSSSNRYRKNIKKGGNCGCSGSGSSGNTNKLFLGGRRSRRNHTRKTSRNHGGGKTRRTKRRRGGMSMNGVNVPPLNSYNNDPRHIQTSEHLTTTVSKNYGGKHKKYGGSLVNNISDPLLGGNPNNVITGFGSSAGVANAINALKGTHYTNSNDIASMNTAISPLI
jgi:hypothetical protein